MALDVVPGTRVAVRRGVLRVQAERVADLAALAVDPRGEARDLHETGDAEDRPQHLAHLEEVPAEGLERREDINRPQQEGIAYTPVTIHKGRRWSAADAFLKPVRHRSNLTVVTGAQVNRVLFEGRRACGIEAVVGGTVQVFRSRGEVILSAGALHSPKLLQLSGIGPAALLAQHGIPVLKDLPTLAESGLKNFEVTIWHGLYAPKGTPADIQAKLNGALKVALKDPDFIKKQEGLGAVVVTDKRVEPAEHKKFVAAEIAKWSPAGGWS